MADEHANLTVRIDADTMRRLKMESVSCGESIREMVQVAIEDLLMRRAEDRRDAASNFGRCGE